MEDQKYPTFIAKIKLVVQKWHGWSPEGMHIPPTEQILDRVSGSFLCVAEEENKSSIIWGEEDQSSEHDKYVDYIQREGFRLFISRMTPTKVDFNPEYRMKPLNGSEFPVRHRLPLVKKSLQIGESFEIKPFSMDAGVYYTLTLLEVNELK